jgi:hypothetical protein
MEKEAGSSRQNAKGGGGGAGIGGQRSCRRLIRLNDCRPAELPEAGMELGDCDTSWAGAELTEEA